MEAIKIDYSSSDTFYSCPLKYKLKHLDGWRSVHSSSAIRYGHAFHAGMNGYYSHIQEHGWTRDGAAVQRMIEFAHADFEEESKKGNYYPDYRTFENLVQLLTSYIDHFYEDHGFLKVIHTERAFQLLIKPTEKELTYYPHLKPFWFTGRIDMELELNGMVWTNEFKTTGWQLDTVAKELNRSPQVIGYAYAKDKIYHEPPEGCLVTIAYSNARKVKSGDYGKLSIDFRRIPQIYNQVDLEKWREHFISLAAQIQQAKEINHYPPRFQSCYKYGRCEFLALCEQSCQIEKASYHNFIQEEPWDVTKDVDEKDLMIKEEV